MSLAGWLPDGRRVEFAPGKRQVEIVALNTPGSTAPLALVVGGRYFFEFRVNDRWDAGAPRPCVLMHTEEFDLREHSMLHRHGGGGVGVNRLPRYEYEPGDAFEMGSASDFFSSYYRVEVVSFDLPRRTAVLDVTVRVPPPPPVAGPGIPIGGVTVDGGGWIVINGHVVRVPPRGPVFEALSRLAGVQASELLGDADARRTARSAEVTGLARAVSELSGRGSSH
jgi:hypothetical protein